MCTKYGVYFDCYFIESKIFHTFTCVRNLHTHLISHWLVVTRAAGVNIAESGCPSCASDLKICTAEIQDLILGSLNRAIAGKLLGSVDVLRDSYTGEEILLFLLFPSFY